MSKSVPYRDKFSLSEAIKPLKPRIDGNLQLQFSECNGNKKEDSPYRPIYSHFNTPASSSIQTNIQSNEVTYAMSEAKQSYEAWKRLHDQIAHHIDNDFKK